MTGGAPRSSGSAWTALDAADLPGALQRCAAVMDVIGDRAPSRALADCLDLQSVHLGQSGPDPGGGRGCSRRALAMARELRLPARRGVCHQYPGHRRLRTPATWTMRCGWPGRPGRSRDIPGTAARRCGVLLAGVLTEAGDLAAAEQACAATLAQCPGRGRPVEPGRTADVMAILDLQAGRAADAAAHLREAAQIALRAGLWLTILNVLDGCGYLCAATGRSADAVTAWAAYAALIRRHADWPGDARRREEPLRAARQALGPARARAAEERGAAMSWAAAAEYAVMLAEDPGPRQPQAAPGLGGLSARERELVTLVAQGRTDAQIAAELYISVRTVRSHLDRIRDKTGCRRRADLTRLALSAELV